MSAKPCEESILVFGYCWQAQASFDVFLGQCAFHHQATYQCCKRKNVNLKSLKEEMVKEKPYLRKGNGEAMEIISN
jgi:hypothetical protein